MQAHQYSLTLDLSGSFCPNVNSSPSSYVKEYLLISCPIRYLYLPKCGLTMYLTHLNNNCSLLNFFFFNFCLFFFFYKLQILKVLIQNCTAVMLKMLIQKRCAKCTDVLSFSAHNGGLLTNKTKTKKRVLLWIFQLHHEYNVNIHCSLVS